MKSFYLLCTLLITTLAQAQFQNETKVVQQLRGAENYLGWSVAVDKNMVVAGAPESRLFEFSPLNPIEPGQVEFFAITLTGYQPFTYTPPSDLGIDDFFGWDVAISGQYAAVAAPKHPLDANQQNVLSWPGAVYIYQFNGSHWNISQKLVCPDRNDFDQFGWSIAMDGDLLVVGTPGEDLDENNQNYMDYSGAAYVYRRGSNGQYALETKLVGIDRVAFDAFGYDVDVDGNTIIVGSPWNDLDATGGAVQNLSGAAYAFEYDGTQWNFFNKLVAIDREQGDYFGVRVAIDDSTGTAVVGTQLDDSGLSGSTGLYQSGSAYVFNYTPFGYAQTQKLVSGDEEDREGFGQAIDILPGIIAIGAFRDTDGLNGQTASDTAGGAVFVYTLDNTGTWNNVQKITNSDRAPGDHFGRALALSSYDTLGFTAQGLVVGAWKEDEDVSGNNLLERAGSVYLYGQSNIGLFEPSNEPEWTAFPNPAAESLRITHLPVGQKTLTLTDASGRTVGQWQTDDLDFTLRVDAYPAGIYFLEVGADDRTSVRKIRIQ